VRFLFRATRNLLALAMVALIIMVLTPATEWMCREMSVAGPAPRKADVIVCLGGGYGRELTASRLYKQRVAPLVVVCNAPGAAEWMRNVLVGCGVSREHILVDNESYTTGDHPEGVARVSGVDRKKGRFVIVTDHLHSRRALACFVKAGYRQATVVSGDDDKSDSFQARCKWRIGVIPYLVYECAALVQYRWQGKI